MPPEKIASRSVYGRSTPITFSGDFVKRHGLRLGDFVMLYRDDYRQRYVITPA